MIQPGHAPALHRFAHDAMACTFELGLTGEDKPYARRFARAAFDEIDRLEQLLSRFIPHSDIARVNRLRSGEATRVSLETIECLQIADELYRDTNGAFDIAFRSRRTANGAGAPPLILDPEGCTVAAQLTGVELDLGGVGKGYAVDRIVALLDEWSIGTAIVHGGESTVFARGEPPRARGWSIGLRRPDRPDDVFETLELRGVALAGSGQQLHSQHIVDPRSGRPAEANAAAWALAPTAAVADALSTALMILSAAEARVLCQRRPGVSAILWPTGATVQDVRWIPPRSDGPRHEQGHARETGEA